MSALSLVLSPVHDSFPFATKSILMTSGTKIILGSNDANLVQKRARVPPKKCGWFPPYKPEASSDTSGVSPLSLSSFHAEVWYNDEKVYIRDLESAFGTYVNDERILQDTHLKDGDTICLGVRIESNDKTPAYITELHLTPVIAKVSLSGLS